MVVDTARGPSDQSAARAELPPDRGYFNWGELPVVGEAKKLFDDEVEG